MYVQNKYKYILCTLSKKIMNMLSHTAKFAAPSFQCRETVYLFRGRQDKEILKIFNCIFNFYLPILSPFFPFYIISATKNLLTSSEKKERKKKYFPPPTTENYCQFFLLSYLL